MYYWGEKRFLVRNTYLEEQKTNEHVQNKDMKMHDKNILILCQQ